MFKTKKDNDNKFSLEGITPLTTKDFPNWDVKNVRVVSEKKCEFSLQLCEALVIHGMQCVERKDGSGAFIAPPQTSYKVKEGFYKNRNNAFIYLDEAFSSAIIQLIMNEAGDNDEK